MPIEWNVTVFDKEGTDRTAFRAAHLAGIPATVNDGVVTSAGGLYSDASRTRLIGSAFHLLAASKEEILEFLKKDVYYKNGIWDLNTVVAHPIGVAVREPKKLDGVNKF